MPPWHQSTGRLVVESPAGWDQPVTGFEVTFACGAKATETTEVPIPLSLTAGAVTPRGEFVSDGAVLAADSSPLTVPVAAPLTAPLIFSISGILGHGLCRSGRGFALEWHLDGGGVTRRYSSVTSLGSCFAFTGKVTPGRALIVRAIETSDWARTDDYNITVNSTKVANRLYEYSAGGEGPAPARP